MEESFEFRAYSFSELAQLYNPHVHPRTAVRTLQIWIDRYPGLRDRLTGAGMVQKTRILTPMQVAMIVKALGTP